MFCQEGRQPLSNPKAGREPIVGSDLLGFWTFSIVQNSKHSKTQRFENWTTHVR
jgi:hypothetical protein